MRGLSMVLYLGVLAWSAHAHAEDELEPFPDAMGETADDTAAGSPDSVMAPNEVEPVGDDEAYPLRFARRPLVMNKGMVRGDARLTVGGTMGPGTFASLDLGGAVTPLDNLEVGVSSRRTGAIPSLAGSGLIGVIFSPAGSYGDIPVYARYQFYEGSSFLAGVDLVMVLPVNTDFTLTAGVPMRVLELFKIFTLDFNLDLRYRAGDKFVPAGGSDATFDVSFSGASTISITDHGFIEVGGGVALVNVNGAPGSNNVIELPAFVGGGYTYQGKDQLLVDFFAQFGWQPLMTANKPTGRSTFNVGDDWFVMFGATVYTKPLFGD